MILAAALTVPSSWAVPKASTLDASFEAVRSVATSAAGLRSLALPPSVGSTGEAKQPKKSVAHQPVAAGQISVVHQPMAAGQISVPKLVEKSRLAFRSWILACGNADPESLAGGLALERRRETGRRFLIAWAALTPSERGDSAAACGIGSSEVETAYRGLSLAIFPVAAQETGGAAADESRALPISGSGGEEAFLELNRIEASLLYEPAPITEKNAALLSLLSRPSLFLTLQSAEEGSRYAKLREAATLQLTMLYQSVDTECMARLASSSSVAAAAKRALGSSPVSLKGEVVDSSRSVPIGRAVAFLVTATGKGGKTVDIPVAPEAAGPVYARGFVSRLGLRLPPDAVGEASLLSNYCQAVVSANLLAPGATTLPAGGGTVFGFPRDAVWAGYLSRTFASTSLVPEAARAGIPLAVVLPSNLLAFIGAGSDAPSAAPAGCLADILAASSRLSEAVGPMGGGR
jgi:hypothetical protein